MILKSDEAIYSCLEFENYYQFSIKPKDKLKERMVGGVKLYALKKDFSEEFQYYVTELEEVKKKFGEYKRELDLDEIDNLLEEYDKKRS